MSIKVWIAMRLQVAFRKERKAWRVVAPRKVANEDMALMPWWAVDDRRFMDMPVSPEPMAIPDFRIQTHSFDNEVDAADFISRVCWIAAVDHLLHFWRKEP